MFVAADALISSPRRGAMFVYGRLSCATNCRTGASTRRPNMRKISPDNPALFHNDLSPETDEILQLDKPALAKALCLIRSADSLASLRQSVANLKNELTNDASPLRAASTEDVEFSSRHLSEELEQIAASQTLERAFYYVDRLVKSITEVRFGDVNDINLNRWKEYSDIYLDSLWNIDRRDSSGVHSAGYWGNFIPQIPYQMMRRYTKKGEWVLDTFCGLGTTLIEGRRLGRNTLGIELQPDVAERARHLVGVEPNEHDVVCDIVTGDSITIDYNSLLGHYGRKSVQLVIMHPPYFDIIKFSDEPADLSNAANVEAFLTLMGKVVDRATAVLDKGRYLALVIGDKYSKGEWIPLGFLVMNEVLKSGCYTLKSIIVKNFEETTGKRQQKELWRYRALVGGFYIFKHEYIFVFRKT